MITVTMPVYTVLSSVQYIDSAIARYIYFIIKGRAFYGVLWLPLVFSICLLLFHFHTHFLPFPSVSQSVSQSVINPQH